MYRKCGQVQRAISILEDYVNAHASEADLGAVDLLISLYMENNSHNEALRQLEHAHTAYCLKKGLPLHLKTKAVICHAYLGNMENVEVCCHPFILQHVHFLVNKSSHEINFYLFTHLPFFFAAKIIQSLAVSLLANYNLIT